jgi:hypothetical protein
MVNSNLLRLEHYYHEYLTWERTLDFFKQENAFLKTRLSQVVDKKMDKDFLAHAEHFQNQFIIKDEFIDELNHDVHEMQGVCEREMKILKINPDKKTESRHNKLRNEIEFLEKNFTQLKNEFNKYILSVLQ